MSRPSSRRCDSNGLSGTPVTETRVRVPHGDVVHTVYTCADAGGVTVIEVVNESTLPVAIAFDRRDVMTERPIADVPIEGIELPEGSFVLALGHRARLRVGIASRRRGRRRAPCRVAVGGTGGRRLVGAHRASEPLRVARR